MIFLGSDHRGYLVKEEIKLFLNLKNIQYIDLGADSNKSSVDYPDYALKVCRHITDSTDRGILICQTGVGMCMAANKVKGIKAAVVWNLELAKKSRQDNNTNVLCLPAKYVASKNLAQIVNTWLETKFSGEGRQVKRLQKIKKFESKS